MIEAFLPLSPSGERVAERSEVGRGAVVRGTDLLCPSPFRRFAAPSLSPEGEREL
jgi:hypothetical protein